MRMTTRLGSWICLNSTVAELLIHPAILKKIYEKILKELT